jgi:iron complex transport system ATP-binding protein
VADAAFALSGIRIVRQGHALLDGVDWTVGHGERWVLLGPNGSGKTTLLRVAGMQVLPTSGAVEVLGERFGATDVRAVRRRIAFVSQSLLRRLRPALVAHDAVMSGRYDALEPHWHRYGPEDHRRADALLEAAGLGAVSARPVGELSEGERQQVLLARALMGEPDLLLLDEPAAGLDLGARERLVARLAALAADPGTPAMVLVTHHTEEIPPGVTHAALLRKGRMVAAGPAGAVLTDEHVSSCFGVTVAVETSDGRWTTRVRTR